MKSGGFICPRLRKLAADLLSEPIQAAVAAKESPAIAEEIGEFPLDVREHLGAEGNAVIGEHRVELGGGQYHFQADRLRC